MAAKPKSNELKISRLYDAPVEAVWDAWVDPKKAAHWWGPRGFTITTHSKDLRPGGTWVYTMHGPDGTDYPNITFYHEVRRHEALVYDHGASEGKPPMFRMTVLFKPRGGKTAIEITMTLPTPEAAEQTAKFVKKAGGNATWDRLAEYLEERTSGREVFVINAAFDAPLDRVFAMWTDPRHLAQWLPPAGMEMEVVRGEIKPGGGIFARMYGGSVEFYFRTAYREVGPDRIVYAQQFCDREENVSRHPFAPAWPETMLTTVLFTAESLERTRVTVRSETADGTTQAELECFVKERGGMTIGWTGSFDKLESLLAA